MEGSNEGEPPRERFDGGTRDKALYHLSRNGWCNESGGDKASPAGWFARISIEPAELPEIVQAFKDDLGELSSTDWGDLLGHHMVYEDADGVVSSDHFTTEGLARRAFQAQLAEYEA